MSRLFFVDDMGVPVTDENADMIVIIAHHDANFFPILSEFDKT